jgi:ABC-type multidrug transport system fused ATPase/permease subunit
MVNKQQAPLRYFLSFGLKYKGYIFLYFICMVAASSSKAYPVYLVKEYLSEIFGNGSVRRLLFIVGQIALSGLGLGLFSYFYRYLSNYLTYRVTIDIKNRVYTHFTELPLEFFESKEKGDLITKMTHDTGSVSNMIKRFFVTFIPKPIEAFCYMVVCFILSWQLSLLFLLIVPGVLIIIRIFGSEITRRSRREKERLSASTVTMEQFFYGIKLIKSMYSHKLEEDKFRNVNRKLLNAHMSTVRAECRSVSILELVGALFAAALIGLGGYLILNDSLGLEPESFVSFIIAVGVAMAPIREGGREMVNMMRAIPSISRLYDILQTKSHITVPHGATPLEGIEPGIEFRDVRFSYGKDEVIKGVNLTIRPGEMVSFVGPSGGGKTTLLDLIPRFYEVDAGSIYISGRDIRTVTAESLMSHVAIVLQDSFIFNSSALENIRYGMPDATEEQVVDAAKRAHIHDEIMKLPEGYDNFLGESGSQLSGGQKQRVSIARSLLKGAPILIMDEPTSNLDSDSENYIMDTLETIKAENKIILTIAHRLSTVLKSDRIVVIKDGTVEADGTHDELLKTSPTYKAMVDAQFRDFTQ